MYAAEAQQPDRLVEHADLLPQWIKDWERQGLVTAEQGQAILGYENVKPRALSIRRMYGRLITVLATMGAVLVGVGIILFVGTNWQGMPTPVKLLMIIGVIGATNLAAYQLKYVWSYPRIGGALLFLASFFYGAGIFLVAQVYHMNANDPDLLVMWFIGVLPIVYLTRSRAMMSSSILVALGAIGWKAATLLEDVDAPHLFFALYLVVGAALYALGTLHLRFKGTTIYALPFTGLGSLLVLTFSFILGFNEVLDDLYLWGYGGYAIPGPFVALIVISAAVAVVSVVIGIVVDRLEERRWGVLPYEAAAVLVVLAAGFSLVPLAPHSATGGYTLAFNVLFLALVVGTIVHGALAQRAIFVNMGLFFFGAFVMARYFELFFDMMDTALFFIVGGVILLVGGFLLERASRRLMKSLQLVEVEDE